MTPTDELRRMLDERGIEWRWEDERTTYWYVTVDGEEWGEWTAIEMGGYLHLSFSSEDVLTPAQAVEATLGAGTCSIVARYMDWYCTGCGEMVGTCDVTHELHIDGNAIKLWRYCPNCGRKVVDEWPTPRRPRSVRE